MRFANFYLARQLTKAQLYENISTVSNALERQMQVHRDYSHTSDEPIFSCYICDHPSGPFLNVLPAAIAQPWEIAKLRLSECALLILPPGFDHD